MVDWTKYRTQLESLPEERRRPAREFVERLVQEKAISADDAMLEAMRRFSPATRQDAPKHPDVITSPDISLAAPHGPEGESHGGRGGADPLQFVEDATPTGTNPYSRTRGSPAKARRGQRPRAKSPRERAIQEDEGRVKSRRGRKVAGTRRPFGLKKRSTK